MSLNKLAYSFLLICLSQQVYGQVKLPSVEPAEERYKSLETLAKGLYLLETMYVDPNLVKSDKLIENALRGVVNELDPHTMLLPKKAFEQLTVDTQGRFGGVGIIVSQERGKIIVISPIEGTPASSAGVLSGDEILSIAGQKVSAEAGAQAIDKMRGPPGSILELVVKRKSVDKPIKFSLKREIIKVKSVRSESLEPGFVHARIASFQEETSAELAEILLKDKKEMKGLVLDMRDNPGGLLDQAVRVVDLFVESGIIVSTVGRDPKQIEREFAHKRDTYSEFPIVVLVNGGSASASEIVAGALQDHKRGLIMGETTFGKGSVQTLIPLPDGSGLKLTVAKYYTPNDRSIQAVGIKPDIYVEASPSKKPEDTPNQTKEKDLKGHIEAKNLSEFSKDEGITKSIDKWSDTNKKDQQLVSAFTYLKGWSVFSKH